MNSVKFVVDMLNRNNVESKYVEVIDNNCIDREVTRYRPTHVVIEALWVVPEKFEILIKLHPTVKWIVRLHSETPFIAGEGIAMDWIYGYAKYDNVTLACNSLRILDDMEYVTKKQVMYLPNYYDVSLSTPRIVNPIPKDPDFIDIGCFGAIRPLKNQFQQAIAAMEFGTKVGKKIRFHINTSRVEGKGEPNLRNIRSLFKNNLHGHELVEHGWMNHDVFVGLIGQMDLMLQVSFTETYNIVAADTISQNVPIVASKEIQFVSRLFQADCTSTPDIVCKLRRARILSRLGLQWLNKFKLGINARLSQHQWLSIFR